MLIVMQNRPGPVYPSMRKILRQRLVDLNFDDVEGFLKWLWPPQKSGYLGDYEKNTRFYTFRREDADGLPRFSIDHYLASGCSPAAITSTLPPITDGKFKLGQVTWDWKRKKHIQNLSNSANRVERCNELKRNFIERDGSQGWTPLYTDDYLRNLYIVYLSHRIEKKKRIKTQQRDGILRSFMESPDQYPDYYKRGLYDTAKKIQNPQWVALVKQLHSYGLHRDFKKYMFDVGGVVDKIKTIGRQRGWDALPQPTKQQRSGDYFQMAKALKNLPREFTPQGQAQYDEAQALLGSLRPPQNTTRNPITVQPSRSQEQVLSSSQLQHIFDDMQSQPNGNPLPNSLNLSELLRIWQQGNALSNGRQPRNQQIPERQSQRTRNASNGRQTRDQSSLRYFG